MFSQGLFTPITLDNLHHIETLQQVKFIDVQILRILNQQRSVNNLALSYSYICDRNTRVHSRQVKYTRLFLVHIFNKTEMDKLAYTMEAKGVNQIIWYRHIELRDNGKLSIGIIIRMLAPRLLDY